MEFRPFYLGRELARLGHAVTVIAADHSHLRVKNPAVRRDFEEEWMDGVRYVYLKTPPYRGNGPRRLANMLCFLSKLRQNAKRIYRDFRPDAVVASSTYPYDVREAARIASCGEGTALLYEIHDLWPLSLIELYGLSPRNPYIKSLQRAEDYAYQNADAVISILPHAVRHIRERGFRQLPCYHIPNGIVLEGEREPPPRRLRLQAEEWKRKGKFLLMYLGGFSTANAVDDLLAAAQRLPDGIQLILVGDGPLKTEYEKRPFKNAAFFPPVSKNQVISTLALADALYIGAKKTPLYRFGVGMNKFYDYMAAGRPILSAVEASNNPVAEAGCGLSARAEDAASIAGAILQLAEMPEEKRTKMGERGYGYAAKYHDYRKLAERFAEAVGETVRNRRGNR